MPRSEIAIVALSLAIMCRPVLAQSPLPVNPMDQNAALSYWTAFALLPQIKDDVRKKLTAALSGEAPIDNDLLGLASSSEIALRYFHRGAQIDSCAWGIAYETGPYAYMPHLSKSRELAKVALLRARIRFENDQPEEATEDVLAAVQLGRHAGQEGVVVLINVLVGFAIESMAIETIADSLYRLDQGQRDKFQREFNQIKPTLDMKRALQGEKDVFLGWLIREIENGRSRDAILDLVSGDVDARLVNRVKKASQDQLLKFARDLNAVYDAGIEFMSLPPAEAMRRAEKLAAGLQDENTGNPLGALFLPGFGAARRSEATFLTRKALFKAAVAVSRDGADALKRPEHRDPFGDGPFQLKRVVGGAQLVAALKRGNAPITLRVPGLSE